MEYKCNICNKYYSSYQSLWIHNNKFHLDKVLKTSDKVINYNCRYCIKQYNNLKTRWSHEQKCKEKNSEIIELKKEIELLKNTNNQLITNNTNNTNNGIINNTNNNTNNYIIIQPNGNEKISDFSIKEISEIINSGNNSIIKCTEMIHFNKNRPQYHGFCSTSLEGNYFNVIDKEDK